VKKIQPKGAVVQGFFNRSATAVVFNRTSAALQLSLEMPDVSTHLSRSQARSPGPSPCPPDQEEEQAQKSPTSTTKQGRQEIS